MDQSAESPVINRDPFIKEQVGPKKWDYQTFRSHLLDLGRGERYLPKNELFPNTIQLSDDWHTVLNRKRVHTHNDQTERFSGIVTSPDGNKLFLPNFALVGESGSVPGEVILEEIERARNSLGENRMIGDIHSHPKKLYTGLRRFLNNISAQKGSFSLGDLYGSATKGVPNFLKVVVEGEENIFVFRSSETIPTLIDPNIMSQKTFVKHWYEKNGWRYTGSGKDGEVATPDLPNSPSIWDLNKMIAKKHNLVLYRGLQGKDLQRVVL